MKDSNNFTEVDKQNSIMENNNSSIFENSFDNNSCPTMYYSINKEKIIEVNQKAEFFFHLDKVEIIENGLSKLIEFPSNFNYHLFEENLSKLLKCKIIQDKCDTKEVDIHCFFRLINGEKLLVLQINSAKYQYDLDIELNSLRKFFHHTDDIAFISDLDGNITIPNKSFIKITGENQTKNVIGRKFSELMKIEPNSSQYNIISKDEKDVINLNDGELIIRNEEYTLSDGLKHKFFCRKYPIYSNNCLIATAVLMTDKTDRYRLEEQNLVRQNRIDKQKSALITLMQTNTVFNDNPERIFSSVTRICARCIDVERASIWLYNEEKTKLRCVDLYVKSQKKQYSGEVLLMEYFPVYRQALSFNLTFTISNVYEDSRTSEFVDLYLKPNNIYSMIDAPIRFAGDIIGFLCFEHTDSIRQWYDDEELFATAVADLLAQIYSLIKFKELQKEMSK